VRSGWDRRCGRPIPVQRGLHGRTGSSSSRSERHAGLVRRYSYEDNNVPSTPVRVGLPWTPAGPFTYPDGSKPSNRRQPFAPPSAWRPPAGVPAGGAERQRPSQAVHARGVRAVECRHPVFDDTGRRRTRTAPPAGQRQGRGHGVNVTATATRERPRSAWSPVPAVAKHPTTKGRERAPCPSWCQEGSAASGWHRATSTATTAAACIERTRPARRDAHRAAALDATIIATAIRRCARSGWLLAVPWLFSIYLLTQAVIAALRQAR
jgi:hypothetical protein